MKTFKSLLSEVYELPAEKTDPGSELYIRQVDQLNSHTYTRSFHTPPTPERSNPKLNVVKTHFIPNAVFADDPYDADKGSYSMSFSVNSQYAKIPGEHSRSIPDTLKIMGTVLSHAKHFVKSNPHVHTLTYSATGDSEEEVKSKQKHYSAIISKFRKEVPHLSFKEEDPISDISYPAPITISLSA